MTSAQWSRELRAIVDDLDPGARIEMRPGHTVVHLTNGARCYVSSSPSCWRTEKNTRRDIKRALASVAR